MQYFYFYKNLTPSALVCSCFKLYLLYILAIATTSATPDMDYSYGLE